jgi:alpha-tubulin suppressor-like RCC1 family protein
LTIWATINNPPAESGTYTSGIVSVGKETTWTELVLKSDGTVWAWGNNWDGELGNGSNTNSTTPVQVSNITNVGAISAGGTFAAALSN